MEGGIVEAGGSPNETTLAGTQDDVKKLVKSSFGGTDDVMLEGVNLIKDFPIGIPVFKWDAGHTYLHALGLGTNSTYLNALQKAGNIGSRVWSMFWGRAWVKDDIDGSLVLGGYDEEKVTGDNYTAPLDYNDYVGSSGCFTGMRVVLSDIKVNFRNGTEKSIFPTDTALPCCIDPHHHLLLDAPTEYVSNFQQVTGLFASSEAYSRGFHYDALMFERDNAFDGDITFHLDSGLQIRVPNDQYIVPSVGYQSNGSRIRDLDNYELLIRGHNDDAESHLQGMPALLGRYFLTAAYLMVNQDAGTFTLWQAKPSKSSKLVRVFDEEMGDKCGAKSGVIQPSASAYTATTSISATGTTASKGDEEINNPKGSSSPSGAVIAGAVVGSVIGVCLIILGVLYLLHRRVGRRQDTYYYYTHEEMERDQTPEMDASQQKPAGVPVGTRS
ncbi:hypothetical protein NW762_012533 [Fusarium torreyae]|uniref:Peptidase A1 domain-containing protein n=1 Tax=Fusarium torreyae TaxID=1237075 RepID=A0A9W8RQR0_9HYPO|nr:hypothetical protein NW762_012533 [Fusarium torreyae]